MGAAFLQWAPRAPHLDRRGRHLPGHASPRQPGARLARTGPMSHRCVSFGHRSVSFGV